MDGNYYRRLDVRQAILNFARAGDATPVREGAFYDKRLRTLQRYLSMGDSRHKRPIVFDSDLSLEAALREGATAFYSSYWRYSNPDRLSGLIGRDLVWTLRAESGGLNFAKEATVLVLRALEDEGFPDPWVKYSGTLGFDLVLPLETLPGGLPPADARALDELQKGLTGRVVDHLVARAGFAVDANGSKATIRSGSNTCLLSELRWGRGLLLVPMSLHPSSGLVSVPIAPTEVGDFSVMDASPESTCSHEWRVPSPLEEFGVQELEWQALSRPTATA